MLHILYAIYYHMFCAMSAAASYYCMPSAAMYPGQSCLCQGHCCFIHWILYTAMCNEHCYFVPRDCCLTYCMLFIVVYCGHYCLWHFFTPWLCAKGTAASYVGCCVLQCAISIANMYQGHCCLIYFLPILLCAVGIAAFYQEHYCFIYIIFVCFVFPCAMDIATYCQGCCRFIYAKQNT